MSTRRVAVVVVTFNSAEVIPGLIESLGKGLAGMQWHLTVVDNASSDDSLALSRRLAPDATIIETGRNAGYAAGINAGVAASGPFDDLLVLNPDVRLADGCVAALVSALDRTGSGIAVPLLDDADGRMIQSIRREPTLLRAWADALIGAQRVGKWPRLGEHATDPTLYDTEHVIDWAEGSTQLIRADCWHDCGPWDESYFLYSEETDFNLRARDAGWFTVFVPSARAVHLEGDSQSSPSLWRLLVVNRVRLFRRRNGFIRSALFWLANVVREASRAIVGYRTSRVALPALFRPSSFGPQSASSIAKRC